MPHGYECDRCGEFVEQDGEWGPECHSDLHGDSMEVVRIGNPLPQSDGEKIEVYTLCDDCRSELIRVVNQFPIHVEPLS